MTKNEGRISVQVTVGPDEHWVANGYVTSGTLLAWWDAVEREQLFQIASADPRTSGGVVVKVHGYCPIEGTPQLMTTVPQGWCSYRFRLPNESDNPGADATRLNEWVGALEAALGARPDPP